MSATRRIRMLRLLLAAAAWSAGCGGDKPLPTAPSELTTGIIVFEDANYRGKSAYITRDLADLKDFKGPCYTSGDAGPYGSSPGEMNWNDCISSVRVAPGASATLFGDANYRGSRLDVTADVPDLKNVAGDCGSGMNDCVSSIRVAAR